MWSDWTSTIHRSIGKLAIAQRKERILSQLIFHKNQSFVRIQYIKYAHSLSYHVVSLCYFCMWTHFMPLFMLIHRITFNHLPFKVRHKISFNKTESFFSRCSAVMLCVLFICESEPIIPNLTIWCFHRPTIFITIIVIWCSIRMRSAWINATRYFIAFNSFSCVLTIKFDVGP